MYRGYKVVCVTPAGRRRYMKVLVPYILASDLVDEYQIWVNTKDAADIAFFEGLSRLDPRVKLYTLDGIEPDGVHTIGKFFVNCIDPETVYIRFDDDVVFAEEHLFQTLLDHRIDNPRYFLVSPLVINNALCTYMMMATGRFQVTGYTEPYAFADIGWKDERFAEKLHRFFFYRHSRGSLDKLRFGNREIAMSRFSINCISWLGAEFARFGGILPDVPDEEEFLSVTRPLRVGRNLGLTSAALVCHLAFGPQREYLDTTDILDLYAGLCAQRHGALYHRVAALAGVD